MLLQCASGLAMLSLLSIVAIRFSTVRAWLGDHFGPDAKGVILQVNALVLLASVVISSPGLAAALKSGGDKKMLQWCRWIMGANTATLILTYF